MPCRTVVLSLCLGLIATPAVAQSGQAGTTAASPHAPRPPSVSSVAGAGPAKSGANAVNTPESGHGPPGHKSSTGTAPLPGGGGPNGAHSAVSRQHSEATPSPARFVAAAATTSETVADPRVTRHLRTLHQRLHITAAQEPLWQAFAQTMRANAVAMREMWSARRDREAKMSALEDMTNYAAIAQAHAQAMQRLVAAFEPLYTRFTPAQREAARQALRPAPSRVAARH